MEKLSLFAVSLSIIMLAIIWPYKSLATKEVEEINLTRLGFTKSKLKTPTGEIAVFEAGKGEPLLLLHGIGAGASSYIWFEIAPQLAEHYRVIAPDFVGWGESDRLTRDILFEDYVTQITALGEWVGEPVRVLTQSLSCGFVLSAIEKGGIEVIKLVLNTPSGGFDFGVDAIGEQGTQSFLKISESPQRNEIYAQIFHQRPAIEDWWRQEGFKDGEAVPLEIIENNLYNARRPNASYSALPFLSGKLRYDIAPLLENVTVPTIMLWGNEEFRIRPEVQERISKLNPEIEVIRIKDARSAFEVEQPELTLAAIMPFLK
ncbi:alpha/beta fold hydrolase [Fulvivirga lutea]|uniref:Alpha/beta hydrolase n=1 Tax=Fulvivirga lutea TaxID=2810512 RepID=A0A975A1H8_9BACT|nr:alpha/beta hydrolase [Fulvivirga lutea]QSE97841.1 alpha/beta hydrolase [Fulvivirga lutea]